MNRGDRMNKIHHMKKAVISFVALVTAIVMISSCSVGVFAESVGSLQEKINAAKQKAAELEKKEEAANSTYQAKLSVYYAANDAVDDINAEISALQTKITQTQASIDKLTKQIKEEQDAIDKLYSEFKERVKSLYITGSLTSVQVLLDCDDFSEYLTRLEMVSQVSKRDNKAIAEMQEIAERLKKAQEKLNADKKQLVAQEKTLEEDKKGLVKAQQEAKQAYNESLAVLKKIKAQAANNNSQLKEYKAELNDVLAQIAAAKAAQAAKSGSSSSVSSFEIVQGTGQFTYPVPGHGSISCGFYGYANHNGVDFSDGSINGATVVAADSGTVVKVAYLNYSYGYHIFIYHGGSQLTTQYCHLSAIGVSEGQSVSKGQAIGNVGSTGNSTGPHLHFGIMGPGGGFYNPEAYF